MLEINTRVVPISKHASSKLEDSTVLKSMKAREQSFLYITGTINRYDSETIYVLDDVPRSPGDNLGGDHFMRYDFVLYDEWILNDFYSNVFVKG